MKILENKPVTVTGKAKVQFIRIDPEDLQDTLALVLKAIMDLSWLSRFDEDYTRASFESKAQKTIVDIQDKFAKCVDDKITSSAGEYVVSELAREAIVTELSYLDIPLAELLGKKKSGNPGFDFHTQTATTETVVFGEAKYRTRNDAYGAALSSVNQFITDGKDIDDIADLRDFCTSTALTRAHKGNKGFAVAFSTKTKASAAILDAITKNKDFLNLLIHEEILIVAVNL